MLTISDTGDLFENNLSLVLYVYCYKSADARFDIYQYLMLLQATESLP